ncbi:MAG: IS3 family transposase, partial [Candidatus Acetothermia bacterium]|nr:IS3 family transposase [Candidatus Acetothermia bacterium]
MRTRRMYSERRGCVVVGIARSSFRYVPCPRPGEAALTEEIRRLAAEHPAYGYRRIAAVLRREGSLVNRKRVHRIWKAEGLQLPRRRARKRRRGPPGEVIRRAEYPNHVWTYDFIEDRTEQGGKLRMLTVLD